MQCFLKKLNQLALKLRNVMTYSGNSPFWVMKHVQGGGSLVIAISHSLQSFVVDHGSNPTNKCVWVMLLLRDKVVGFFSVYAPNSSSERCILWDWLVSSLSNIEWIWGIDFNMVEWVKDGEGGSSFVICGIEKQAWYKGKAYLQGFHPN
jgi:hypothetical protein